MGHNKRIKNHGISVIYKKSSDNLVRVSRFIVPFVCTYLQANIETEKKCCNRMAIPGYYNYYPQD